MFNHGNLCRNVILQFSFSRQILSLYIVLSQTCGNCGHSWILHSKPDFKYWITDFSDPQWITGPRNRHFSGVLDCTSENFPD